MEHDKHNFLSIDQFLPFYPPNNLENQNFEKMTKKPGDIIMLHMCTINENHDHGFCPPPSPPNPFPPQILWGFFLTFVGVQTSMGELKIYGGSNISYYTISFII